MACNKTTHIITIINLKHEHAFLNHLTVNFNIFNPTEEHKNNERQQSNDKVFNFIPNEHAKSDINT